MSQNTEVLTRINLSTKPPYQRMSKGENKFINKYQYTSAKENTYL
jgi:hypothetical protein